MGANSWPVRLALIVASRQHGVRLSFSPGVIDVCKGRRIIRIAARHFPYLLDMAGSFDQYFGQIVPVPEDGCDVVDYSQPRLHRYTASGLEFELSSFAEEIAAIESYFYWYKPRDGDLVFDMGAYCGVSTYYLSQLVGASGKVYAFEPDPLNFPLLMRNIARHGLTNVVPVQAAFAASSGHAEFFSEGALGSTLAQYGSRAAAGSQTRVQTITFAEACARYGSPAFAKMDIEGAEIAVLSAAADFLRSHPIQFVLDTNHRVDGELTNRAVEHLFLTCNYEVKSSQDSGFMTTWARPRPRA
jgi:FkbM family methyltransferase